MNAPILAAIFDMDGTLIDSEPSYWAAWRNTFSAFGVTLTDEDMRSVMGLRAVEVAAEFLRRYDKSADPRAVADSMVEQMMADPRRNLMPGAREALIMARAAGLKTAVATSAPLALAEASIKAADLDQYFDVVVSGENEEFGKPHPGVFLTAARRLGVAPEQCVAIEDAPNGVRAIKAAGMRSIAVPEEGHRDDPIMLSADHTLASLVDLTEEALAAV